MAIAFCGKIDCVSEFQDKRFGKGMRVFNEAKNASSGLETLRCTVCKGEIVRSKKNDKPDDNKKGKGKKPVDKEVEAVTSAATQPVAGKKKK